MSQPGRIERGADRAVFIPHIRVVFIVWLVVMVVSIMAACGAPSPESRGRAAMDSSVAAGGARRALLSVEASNLAVVVGARCDPPLVRRGGDSLFIDLACSASIPRDTLFLPAPGDTITPPDTIIVPPDTITPPDTVVIPPVVPTTAELPRLVPTWPVALETAGCTSTISAGLQAALDAANAGDVLCLADGARFLGSYTMPARGDNGWVVVRSATSSVAPGTRMRPSLATRLARIIATQGGAAAAITAAPKARGWFVSQLEVTTDSTLAVGAAPILGLATPPDSLSFATDMIFDRLYIHGWPNQTVRRCVTFNGRAAALIDSWVDECHEKGSDSQALYSTSGMGPLLIRNNYLAGAGENILFGGGDPKYKTSPSDITMIGNHIVTPPHWKTRWTKKNIFEIKNARRVLLRGNVLDGSWADGQTGFAFVLKSANQSGACRHCIMADVVIDHNLIVNAAAALNINGLGGASNPVDSTSRRIEYTNNYSDITGDLPWGIDRRGNMMLSNAVNVRIVGNTFVGPKGVGAHLTGSTTKTGTNYTLQRNVFTKGQYPAGACWTAACAPGLVHSDNYLVGVGTTTGVFASWPVVATFDAAHVLGAGITRAAIDAAVRGVVVAR